MPRSTSSIKLVAHGPDHPDGLIHQNDTVTFGITGTGVISILGSRDGQTLWSAGLVRGDLDVVIGPSPSWQASPGPLHMTAMLREQVNGRVKTVATCEFDVVG